MTSRWRKILTKTFDLVLTLPFDENLWPRESEFEKLTIAISFPLLARKPWRAKGSTLLEQFKAQVRELSGQGLLQYWSCLQKLWISARAFQAIPMGMACSMLSG
jgi:hypothetical protein